MGVTVKSRPQSRSTRVPVRKLRIGLVNNMGDGALACTERQFASLLIAVDGAENFELVRYALAGVPRGEAGRAYLTENSYRPAADIADAALDGVIVTGSEPKASDLRAEPYWNELAALFDWIETAGPPAIFSCLATHAAVLHFDSIERRKLAQKRFGSFEHVAVGEHALTRGLPRSWRIAHSRWHELAPDSLAGLDYKILTFAPGAGVGLFVRERRNLLTFFQGHPEYDFCALAREYKRDVKRFLRRESDIYPRTPKNAFDAATCDRLWNFELRAKLARDIALIEEFPDIATTAVDEKNKAAISVYSAWLSYLRDRQPALLPDAGEARRVSIVDLKLPQQAVAAPGDEDIVARLCRIWSRVLNTSPVTADSDFFELGGDSLIAVNLLLEIERETGLSFPVTTIYDAPTVALQVELIAGERQSAFSPLVLLKPGAETTPLFIVHGIGGTVFELAALGREIETERAIYAIQARGIDGNERPRESIAEMAAAYAENVRAVQPNGPYYLAGYSMGGLVALEMARKLLDEHERVEFLLLIDSYAHPMTWPRAARLGMKWRFNRARVLRAWDRPLSETAKNLSSRVKVKFNRSAEGDGAAYAGPRWPAPPEPYLPLALREVHEAGARALLDYVPLRYPGKIAFVKAGTTDVVYPTNAESIWRPLAQHLEVHTAPGDHLALVREHHTHVAQCFSKALAAKSTR